MEKNIIDIKINHYLAWTNVNVEISQMKKDLETIEKLGATHIEIEAWKDEYDDSPYVSINAIARREETDEEAFERLRRQKEAEKEKVRRDLELLEKLKAKYE